MEKAEIIKRVGEVPLSPLAAIPDDHEIWEQTDGGAHFKVTRHQLAAPDEPEMLALSVSGQEAERERIIAEFTAALGPPDSRDVNPVAIEHVDMLAWLIDKD